MYKKIRMLMILAVSLLLVGCQLKPSKDTLAIQTTSPTLEPALTLVPTQEPTPEPTPVQVTFLAVGDDLIHEEVIESGVQEGRKYNYDHLFATLKEDISGADISVINQETILGGSELGFSGYPTFNSPTEIGKAIVTAGFDVVLHSTNHAMDKGKRGIRNTLRFWEEYPKVEVLGIHKTKKDQETITVLDHKGIKIAILNATYGLNGITLSNENSYLVDLLEKETLSRQIKEAKKNADIVVVFPHWGTEYTYKADEKQEKWTKFFADQGVDLVIGSHPHVVQPVEWVEGKQGHHTLVYYSLGNYISYQKEAPRMLGGMAEVTFTKTDSGAKITQAFMTPIITHYEKRKNFRFGTYKLSDYTQELADKHGVIEKEENSEFSLKYMKKLSSKILGDWKRINIKMIE